MNNIEVSSSGERIMITIIVCLTLLTIFCSGDPDIVDGITHKLLGVPVVQEK